MPKPRLPILRTKPGNKNETIIAGATATDASSSNTRDEGEELLRRLNAYRQEWKELIDRMVSSVHFRNSDNIPMLLNWLWTRFPNKVTDLDIEIEFYGNKHAPSQIDTGRSRVALADLRKKVSAYQADERGEKWLLEPPKGKGGHRLRFIPADRPSSAPHAFWNAHLRSFEDPVLVTGSHLFLFDPNQNKIIRYYDFNVKGEPDKEDILDAFKIAHPEESFGLKASKTLEPWRDVYLASGDVIAHESFLKWFHAESSSKILIQRKTSRSITTNEVHRRNVILIGRPQTNPLIETLMKSEPQKSRFAFRIHPLRGALHVSNVCLRDFPELAEFTISSDGMVGPLETERRVFGLFTRFPNPGGRGYITIVSCGHYAMVIARIVDAMTNESHAKELLKQMGWALGEPLPDAFEMIFTVDIAPGGLEGEGFPKLLLWRQC